MSRTRNDKKLVRKNEAEARQVKRDVRTPLEQIMHLKQHRPGESKKEIARLSKNIDNQRGFSAET